jgi:hypothetical protein
VTCPPLRGVVAMGSSEPTPDAIAGAAWWASMTETERAQAGSTKIQESHNDKRTLFLAPTWL